VVHARNLEKKRVQWGGHGDGQIPLMCARGERILNVFLRCPEEKRWKEELLKNKWPHVNSEITLKKIFTVGNATKQRNFGTLAYKIKRRPK
jgi:hypothetical protein